MSKKRRNKKNNKIKKLIFLLIIIALFLLGFFGYKYYKNHYSYIFKLENNVTVYLNDEIKPEDYIKKEKNVKVKYSTVDTTTIGEKKLKYIVTDKFDKKHTYYLTITVKDNIAPVIEGKESVIIYINDEINLEKYISYKDNYDKELKLKTEGKVDTKKEGEYPVKYIVTDKSGNKAEHTITFIVKKKSIYEPFKLENGVVGKTSKGYTIENKNGATYVDGYLIANKTYRLSSNYGSGLTDKTTSAFNEMKASAILDGFDLYIGSGFRSFNTQSTIYKNYVKRDGQEKADTYSARPGHSEHQSGLAIDICDRTEKACINSNYNDTASAKWLSDNAYKYGFILRYPSGKTGETGYKFESWHYRYVGKDLATILYNGGSWITMEDYFGITSKYE